MMMMMMMWGLDHYPFIDYHQDVVPLYISLFHLCNYPRSYHTRKSSSLESCWPVLHYNW